MSVILKRAKILRIYNKPGTLLKNPSDSLKQNPAACLLVTVAPVGGKMTLRDFMVPSEAFCGAYGTAVFKVGRFFFRCQREEGSPPPARLTSLRAPKASHQARYGRMGEVSSM
uniref:Uncharacterized protein n=1 Tax=Pseudo-nitzschia australis TaxID=44445 RepID=A0A7S4EFT3_9STRA